MEYWSIEKMMAFGQILSQPQVEWRGCMYSNGQNDEKIENNFKYHAPKVNQPERYLAIRDKAKELAFLINSLTPASREQSIAFTKLEETVMWANAAIARNE